MHTITEQSELEAFCAQVGHGRYITVDTEFIRERTYYPRLCLLQIANKEQAAVIDPLAGLDLAPVLALMQNPKLIKVFHAARQDIEIFYQMSGHIPVPIFDTQVAAAVCGYGESVSYEMLVRDITGDELDKSSRFTDWAARPLSERQLKYAISDVTHLCPIYETLRKRIEDSGRLAWIEEEHVHLSDPAVYDPHPEEAWKRLKYGHMKPKNLAVLRELAKWREIEAKKADVPRGRIVKDDVLVELAFLAPRREADIESMRRTGGLAKSRTDEIIACVEAALALPASEYPHAASHRRLPQTVVSALEILRLLLKVSADKHGVSAGMIAGRDDLENIALGEPTPAMHGWRYDVFGRAAEQLLRGELKLSVDPKTKQVMFEEVV